MGARILGFLACWAVSFSTVAIADVVDFTTWTEVADPPSAFFSASATSSAATLTAGNGFVSSGTDIGFQSVDGQTPGSSTHGYYFESSSDFTIAIDYSLAFGNSPNGVLGLGFGIGEDSDGMNSAGVALATFNGFPVSNFTGAARINDQDQTPLSLGAAPTLSGSLFIAYDATSGDVTVGAATNPGVAMPTFSSTFSGIQNQWNGDDLMASFFIRSDGAGWNGGTAEAVLSNFRVLEGSVTAVPEPSVLAGLSMGGLLIVGLLYRRRRTFTEPVANACLYS